MAEKRTMTVVIDGVTEAQEIALNDLFAIWQQGGGLGCSRWTCFFADGDGNFRPKITVNGEAAKHQKICDPAMFWTNKEPWRGEYRMDFDAIAWKLREQREKSDG